MDLELSELMELQIGMAVSELHLCGEPSAVSLMKRLCRLSGDKLEVRIPMNCHQRLTHFPENIHTDQRIQAFNSVNSLGNFTEWLFTKH
jgi:hypothetical protein